MGSTSEQLRALLGETAFRALESLASSDSPVSGRAVARALKVAPSTALAALSLLQKAGFAASTAAGQSREWYLDESNPMARKWLEETGGVAVVDGYGPRPQLTAVIFTALGLEYQEVAAFLPDRRPARVRTTRFETDAFTGRHVDWTVYVAEVGAGNTRTAVEVTSAVVALDPHLLLFVGVAGSVKPKDLCRGDVVVADRVYNVHSGKDAWAESEGSVHLGRPASFPASHGAVQLALAVRRSDWVDGLSSGALNAKGNPPRAEIRPIAAGEVVHADDRSSLMAKVRLQLNDVAAVDMESLGLYDAAHVEGLPALSVRGISDSVGDKEPGADDEWQPRAAQHAAAFAFALLRHAEPDDFPQRGAKNLSVATPPVADRPSPAELLLSLPPPVAVAFEWALPLAGERAIAVLIEFAGLGRQPATWLSRFRHRPPAAFQGDGSAALWVLAAQFADSYQHPVTSWISERAAERIEDAVLSAYMYCWAAIAASREPDEGNTEELLQRAETTAPGCRLLTEFLRPAFASDIPAVLAVIAKITDPLDLVFPRPLQDVLKTAAPNHEPDEDFIEFVEELAERYPVFLEQLRLTVALAAATAIRAVPGQISTAQLLLEDLVAGLPAYRQGSAGISALRVLTGSRSSNIPLELARTLCMRAADSGRQDMSFDRDAALAQAQELAQTARDRLRDWGGETGEALAVAAQARAASGDIRGALRLLLPPPDGSAGTAEATSQPVVRFAAELAVGTGNNELALDLASKINDSTDRKLATALALSLRPDSHPESAEEYRSVLSQQPSETRDEQQIRALLGLSMVTTLNESELTRLGQLDPEMADLTRAQSLLTAGKTSQAQILARRYPDSDGALEIRVNCLLSEGRTIEALSALEAHATRRHDERFLMQAALLALSSGIDAEASRLAGRIAGGNDPVRRKIAREVLMDLASRHGKWQDVLIEADRLITDEAVAQADSDRDASLINYRWSQAHALHQLRRMDDAYLVIRAHPRLVPADLNQARLVASVLRTVAPSIAVPASTAVASETDITQAEVLAAVTEAAQAFPQDEELVATAVMTAFAMPAADPPDYALMIKARRLHQQFFERFPDSRFMRPVPVDDALTSLREMLKTQLAPNAETFVQMQRLALTGQLPLSACVSAFGKNYSEALIRNELRCYVINSPDDGVSAGEVAIARKAVNETVVVDISTLFLAPVVIGSVTELQAHFGRLLVAAPQRDDILQAQASLKMRSPGSLGWDPIAGRPIFEEHSLEVTERWATDADNLAEALSYCDVVSDPPPPGEDGHRHRVWSSPIWLARERGVSLISDDAALRAVARNEGVPAFGSLQLLSAIIESGELPASSIDDAHRRLRKIRVADLPLLGRLHEIAAEEGWKPGEYASFLLQRPATWTPLARGWQAYTALITALPIKDPQDLAAWCTAATYGLSLVTIPPTVPTIATALVVWTLLETQDPAALPPLLAGAEHVVRQFTSGADLIEGIVQRLVTTARQVAPPEMVGSIVLPLLSKLEGQAHAEALRYFFAMP